MAAINPSSLTMPSIPLVFPPPHLLSSPTKCTFEFHRIHKVASPLVMGSMDPLSSRKRKSDFSCWPLKQTDPPSASSLEGANHMEFEISRPVLNYQPNLWGSYFASYTPYHDEEARAEEHEVLKEVVRREFLSSSDKPLEHLRLIDTIERLGVAYHFSNEIEESLKEMHDKCDVIEPDDLYYMSLKFRTSRQHGFYIANDIFRKFTDGSRNFLDSLVNDTAGMLSLYEASHLRVRGEDILEKALSFTTLHLKAMALQSNNSLLEEINRALACPLQKELARLYARNHIEIYEHDPSNNQTLLRFAKLDYNMVQSLYKRELKELTRWWEDFQFSKKFPFARDRLVEGYLWATSCLCEPKYTFARSMITRACHVLTALDDIYDAYGTSVELEILTQAIQRWDKSCMQHLPNTMKVYYESLLGLLDQFEKDLAQDGRPNYAPYLQEQIKALSRAYHEEFKWHEAKTIATYEEYQRQIGRPTSAIVFSMTAMYVAMGEVIKDEDFMCLFQVPKGIRGLQTQGRLVDDLAQYEFDHGNGRICTVGCYMKEHGVSKEEAIVGLNKLMEEAWMDMNEEICLHPSSFSKRPMGIALDFARAVDVFYNGEDAFTHVSTRMKDIIKRMFIDPIPF